MSVRGECERYEDVSDEGGGGAGGGCRAKNKNPTQRCEEKRLDESTNPNAPPKNVQDSCQRLWYKLLSTTFVNDSCQRRVSKT